MALILAVVFVGVFVTAVLVMTAATGGASARNKQALATLDSALAVSRPSSALEEDIVDIRKQEVLSSIPWLNRWLTRLDVAASLRALLHQANMKWTVGGLVLMCLASGAAGGYAVNLRTGLFFVSIAFAAAAATGPIVYVLFRRRQRFSRFEQSLPDALDLIVGALRAGHSLTSAIGIVARETADPINREFRICFDEQNFGVDFRTAMLSLAERMPIQDVRIVVTAMLIQKESGGNLAEVLEKVAHIIRGRFRLRKQIQVHTAQGRLTGAILAVLPVVLGFGMFLVNPDHMSILWKRPIGVKMMYTSAIMTIIGGLIIRKIVRIRV